MLSSELIKKIQLIQLKAGRLVTDALVGEYSSTFKGQGMEFDKVREYIPGDDIRSIDWNVTARTTLPHIKIYREEREMTLMLLVDVSSSLRFGTSGSFKNELVAEIAAILAYMAIRNQDKVGLIIFSDHVEKYIPAKKGRSHIWSIVRTLLTHKSKGTKTNISVALDFMAKMCKRHATSFIVSDFYSDSYETSLKQLSKRHEIICILMDDRCDFELPKCGLVDLVDAESGDTIVVDMGDKRVRKNFNKIQKQERSKQENLFRRCKVDFFNCYSSQSVIDPLIKYMHKRERRIR